MSDTRVIEVRDLGKRYKLGVIGGATLSDDIKVVWAKLRGKPNPLVPINEKRTEQRIGDAFWAVRGIDFDVEQGEILGIIGHNGAGKSTLLKLLSRITLPTEGEIKMKGRSSSLLEVGTGFHPELTGRENIFLNGAILGMNRAEISRKLDKIIEFSGIKHHIDTPTKRYSSGMKVRLGFSVAAHLEPEILIIDEVLAVGDADFQRKCLGKMKDVSRSGRTILFVSHNMLSVRSLCTRVIWIHEGKIKENGDTEQVVRNYLKTYSTDFELKEWVGDERPGNESFRLNRVELIKSDDMLTWQTPFKIEIEIESLQVDDNDLHVSIHLYTGDDVLAFASNVKDSIENPEIGKLGVHTVWCEVPGGLLNAGDYRVAAYFFRGGKIYYGQETTIGFFVHEVKRKGTWFGKRKGVVRPVLNWGHKQVS